MSFFGPGGALLAKPALALSQLVIDADKVWSTVVAAAHVPAWALAGWYYRKKVTIAGTAAGAQVLYQVKIIINESIGVDAGNTVYTSGLCKSDFSDLRFTNSAGALLDYWIESYTAKTTATVWVELDSVPIAPGTAEFYLYFGNSAAVSLSSGAATFLAFDNFDDGDLVGWTERDPIACTWSAAAEAAKEGAYGAKGIMVAAGEGGILTWDAATFENCRIEAWIRVPDADTLANCQGGFIIAWLDNNNFYRMRLFDSGATEQFRLSETTAGVSADRATPVFTVAAGTWYKISARVYKSGADLVILGDINDTNYVNYTDATPRATPNSIGIFCASTIAARVWADTFRVSKYVNPEPTFSAWAAQEDYYAAALGITTVKQLATTMAKGDMLVFDGTQLAKITSAGIGKNLVGKDWGNLPAWEYPP